MKYSTLIDINRCTGCWTCSMGCKTAHGLGLDEYRLFVRTIGGGGIDHAGGKWPNLYLKWHPIFTLDCINCHGDADTNGLPYCVYNCPTGALVWGDAEDPNSAYNLRKEELREQGFHMWSQPSWEKTRDDVLYMEKDI